MNRVDTATRWFASQVTRRGFLRGVGGAGVGLGLSMAGATLNMSAASAAGSCASGACGPSPYCDYVIITGLCLSGGCSSGYKGRFYNSYTCSSGEGGSWDESYGGGCRSPGNWRCRDCAMKCTTGGAAVSGCGSSGWYACIRVKHL